MKMHGTVMQESQPGETSTEKGLTQELTDGMLVVNKPGDITSAAVVKMIKRLPGVEKAGHTGTLDPFATGVLVCPVNRATRLSRFFLHGSKKYYAVMTLGTETDTLDRTGRITACHPVPELSEERILRAVKSFSGEIRQVPPAFSALKHNGIPLYKYARKGSPVQKPARTVWIENIRVTRIALPEVYFEVTCSAGTYIRSLCADIGKTLGCGGHLSQLVRTASCGFSITSTVGIEKLQEVETIEELNRFVIPMAEAIADMPACFANSRLSEKIKHGRSLSAEDIEADCRTRAGDRIRILDQKNRLLAVIENKHGINPDEIVYSYCCVFHYT